MDINGISMMWACHLNKHIKGTIVNGTSLLYIFAQKKHKWWSFLKPQTMEVPLLCVSLWVGGTWWACKNIKTIGSLQGQLFLDTSLVKDHQGHGTKMRAEVKWLKRCINRGLTWCEVPGSTLAVGQQQSHSGCWYSNGTCIAIRTRARIKNLNRSI